MSRENIAYLTCRASGEAVWLNYGYDRTGDWKIDLAEFFAGNENIDRDFEDENGRFWDNWSTGDSEEFRYWQKVGERLSAAEKNGEKIREMSGAAGRLSDLYYQECDRAVREFCNDPEVMSDVLAECSEEFLRKAEAEISESSGERE